MSRNKHRHEREVLEGLPAFAPAPLRTMSLSGRIMNWVISGNADGAEAVQELFPLPQDKWLEELVRIEAEGGELIF